MSKSCFSALLLVVSFSLFDLPLHGQDEEVKEEPKLVIDSEGHQNVIKEILFSPDGSKLITLGLDKNIRIWDADDGKLVDTLRKEIGDGFAGALYAGAISNDGRLLAVGGRDLAVGVGNDSSVRVIDLEAKKIVAVLSGHTGTITELAFSGNDRILASGSLDETVRLWNVSDLGNRGEIAEDAGDDPVRDHLRLTGHRGGVYQISFAEENGKFMMVSSSAFGSSNLKFWDLTTMKLEVEKGGDLRSLSPDKVVDLEKHDAPVFAASISPDGKFVVSGDVRGNLFVWNALTGEFLKELIPSSGTPVSVVKFSSRGGLVLVSSRAAGSSGETSVYRLGDEAERIGAFELHTSVVTAAAWDPVNDRIATSGGSLNDLFVWEPGKDDPDLHMKGKGEPVFDVAFSKSEEEVVVAFGLSIPKSGKLDDKELSYTFDFLNLELKQIEEGNSDLNFRRTVETFGDLKLEREDLHTIKVGDSATIDFGKARRLRALAYSFAPGGGVIVGGDGGLSRYDREAEVTREFVGHEGEIWAVSPSSTGKYLASGSHDRTLRLWNLETGDLLVSLFVIDPQKGEWVVWTPDGYYVASSTEGKFIGWHFNKGPNELAGFLTGDQLFEHYFRPEVIERVVKERKKSSEVVKALQLEFDLREAERTAPEVEFAGIEDGATAETRLQEVMVSGLDKGSGVAEVRLFHQGKLLEPDGPGEIEGDRIHIPFQISFLKGTNEIKAVAVNSKGVESEPLELTAKYDGEKATSKLHVLAVGLNEYLNPKYDLGFCKADAGEIVNKLRENSVGLFREAPVIEIYDAEATRPAIEAEFAKIAQLSKAEDTFIFFFAGHGAMGGNGEPDAEDEFHLILHDVKQMYGDPEQLEEKAISALRLKDLCQSIKATKQLIVMDACQSGGLVETFAMRGAAEERAIAQLARTSGTLVLAATGRDRFAREAPDLGHGLFTFSIIEALSGKGDSNDDQRITVAELKLWLDARLPELSEKYTGIAQVPTGFMYGNDFPFGLIERGQKTALK